MHDQFIFTKYNVIRLKLYEFINLHVIPGHLYENDNF